MNKLNLALITSSLALILSGCGGGAGGSGDASFDTGDTKISIVLCNTTTPVFTDIKDGDLLVKESTPTVVNVVHDSNNNKKVCVVSGSAHLLRDN